MAYIKEKIITSVNVVKISQFVVLAGLAMLVPYFFHSQWITGPLVNAGLILALFLIGIRSAVVVALVPSLMALAGGLLPAILAPVIPFIMISNIIFVFSIDWFYNNFKNNQVAYWLGVSIGAFLKFLFLFLSVNIISKLLIKQELAMRIAQMMSWPQLITAMAGGLIVFMILKWLKRI